jgi:hypothetical protein
MAAACSRARVARLAGAARGVAGRAAHAWPGSPASHAPPHRRGCARARHAGSASAASVAGSRPLAPRVAGRPCRSEPRPSRTVVRLDGGLATLAEAEVGSARHRGRASVPAPVTGCVRAHPHRGARLPGACPPVWWLPRTGSACECTDWRACPATVRARTDGEGTLMSILLLIDN